MCSSDLDIDRRQVSRAQSNSRRAGVEGVINWQVGDFEEQAQRAAAWLDEISPLTASQDTQNDTPSGRRAILLMNLPYGQRLSGDFNSPKPSHRHKSNKVIESKDTEVTGSVESAEDIEREARELDAQARKFFRDLGAQLKTQFKGCEAWLLVGEQSPWREIGLKPQQQIQLRNGPIKVKLVQIPIY